MLDEGVKPRGAAAVVIADGPAVRCRHACHAIELVVLSGTGVGRGYD